MRLLVVFAIVAAIKAADAATVLPIEIDRGNPVVVANIAGVPVRLVVDSGGDGALSLKASVLAAIHVDAIAGTDEVIDALGKLRRASRFVVPSVELGGS